MGAVYGFDDAPAQHFDVARGALDQRKVGDAKDGSHARDEFSARHVVFKREQQTRGQAAHFFRAEVFDRGEHVALQHLGEVGAISFL